MKQNVGSFDRALRVLGAAAMVGGAALAPFPMEMRLPVFGGLSVYLLLTALSGTCLGYRLMGRSTCKVSTG